MGIEQRYVNGIEAFGAQYDHQALYEMVQSMNVEAVSNVSRSWADLGRKVAEHDEEFVARATAKLTEHWQGAAANAARASVDTYAKSAPEFAEAVAGVTAPLDLVVWTVEKLRAEMPEVQPLNWYDNATPWQSDMDQEHYRRRDEAFRLLRTLYPPAVRGVDEAIPVFPELSKTVQFPDTGEPGGPGGWSPRRVGVGGFADVGKR